MLLKHGGNVNARGNDGKIPADTTWADSDEGVELRAVTELSYSSTVRFRFVSCVWEIRRIYES